MRHMQAERDTRSASPHRQTRLRQLGLAVGASAGLALCLALPVAAEDAAEESAKGGLVTSTASPRVDAPSPQAHVPAARAPLPDGSDPSATRPAASAATATGASNGMQPPAAPAPAPVDPLFEPPVDPLFEPPADPLFERMEAEAELAAAHARLMEADRAVGVMLHRNHPRGDARAELLAEQAEAERGFHEAQAAVDHLDARDGW